MEIRSALWQKLFILPIAFLFGACGLGALVVPFVPAMHTTVRSGRVMPVSPPEIVLCLVMGIGFLMSGYLLLRAVFSYSIRADEEGIYQTNGLFRQSVRWNEVAAYYEEPNRRYYKERRMHIEPVLLNADGDIIFQSYAHLLVSTRPIIEQRRALWSYVESQLAGKEIEEPKIELDPQVLAARELATKWPAKSTAAKIVRIFALVLYICFWFGLGAVPLYYSLAHHIEIPELWGFVLLVIMFCGPLLPHVIWLEWRKRQIARQLKAKGLVK